MKAFEFRNQATAFIKSVCKQRLFLDAQGKSKNLTANKDARFLDIHLKAYPNRSDSTMAAFWMRNHDKIFNVITGSRSKTISKRHQQFQELHDEAKRLFNNHIITPKIKIHGYTHTQA